MAWLPSVRITLASALSGLVLLVFASRPAAAEPAADPQLEAAEREYFEKQVRPILAERCHACHGTGEAAKGGLRIISRAQLLAGGDSGPAIAPGAPDESLLIQAIRYGDDSYQMPPKGRLPEAEIAALTDWVRRGAPWPAELEAKPQAAENPAFDLASRADHWSFRPLVVAVPPAVRDIAWPREPLDRFILARLEAAGLPTAATAARATLIRRVTYDLTGLPATPEEVVAFEADDSPDAWPRLIDRLLASPQYGETWGRHWLDLVRYAETHGHEFDYDIPHAWQYRDYVIRAFNADLPYDQFVREHLAGDLLSPPRRHPVEGFNESILGTAFFHLGEATHSPVDIRGDEADRIDNQIDVLTKCFLGLTVACARCHDHKFDPISTRDYYALVGFVRSSRYQQAFIDGPELNAAALAQLAELRQQQKQVLLARLAEQAPQLQRQLAALLRAALGISAVADGEQPALEATLVSRWTEHLAGPARTDAANPWHALVQLAQEQATAPPEQFASARQALAARLGAACAEHERLAAAGQVFADFDGSQGEAWQATGDAFLAGPAQAMAVRAEPSAAGDVPQVTPAGVVDSGQASARLRGALRSPSFTIQAPLVAYRVRGRGEIKLVVDSHRLIFGPLHGALNLRVDQPQGFQWVTQNVAEYVGHRAHLELLDETDEALSVDRVEFRGDPPPAAAPLAAIVALLERADLDSAAKLIDAYAELAATACRQLGSNSRDAAGLSPESALLGWFCEHAELAPSAFALVTRTQRESLTRLENQLRQSRRAPALADGTGENVCVHIRGSHKNLGEEVPRRSIEVLDGGISPIQSTGSGRLELAQHLLRTDRPLAARVIVNRIWRHHFGRGLVATPDDFGHMGQPPTHPELLEYLTDEFLRGGWSIKSLHRRILNSATYRMASVAEAEADRLDPDNKLWHRMPIRRLEAENVRDAILAVSGRLETVAGGPSVPVFLTPFMAGRGRPEHSGPLDGAGRRSVYLAVRRNFLTPMLVAFDFPAPASTVGQRNCSNVPAQGLTLMNDPFVIEAARHWAGRLLQENLPPHERVDRMTRAALGRPATQSEITRALEFIDQQAARYPAEAELHAWADYGQVLFNAKEFIFIP